MNCLTAPEPSSALHADQTYDTPPLGLQEQLKRYTVSINADESINTESISFVPVLELAKLTLFNDILCTSPVLSCSLILLSDVVSNAYSTVEYRLNTLRIQSISELQKKVQRSRSDVQRYLNLGWIGVYEMLAERCLGMGNLMDLSQKFHLFLLLLQHFFFKLEKILALWEKVLCLLLLYLLFSEFPNRLRPLCTTMPWTIWPVLVVLWGVCWMFYEEPNWNWGDQGELPTAGSTTGLVGNIGHTDLSQGYYNLFPFFSMRH